jgi:AcrR family transcriptional regulator
VGESRPYHHGDLPTALLDAVAELIREGGLEAVSLRAAARRAGVSHAAPAHHFGDKSGLLAAFAVQGFVAFARALEDARDAVEGSPADGLRAMGLAYLDFAREHRPWFEVMFRPELVGDHHDEMAASGAGAFGVLLDQVTTCLGADAPDEDAVDLALAAWATVHGLAHLLVDGPLAAVSPQLSTAGGDLPALAVLVAGMRTHPRWVGDTRPT